MRRLLVLFLLAFSLPSPLLSRETEIPARADSAKVRETWLEHFGSDTTATGEGWALRTARSLVRSLTARNRALDSLYILQPATRWTISWYNRMIRTGVDMHSSIRQTETVPGESRVTEATFDTGLHRRLYKQVGVGFSYGDLILSYGVDMGNAGPGKNRYSAFSFVKPAFGLDLQYYRIFELAEGRLTPAGAGPVAVTSTLPGQLRNFYADAFWVFNYRHFAYTAVSLGNVIQQRSAGSWMMVGKYLQGEYSVDPADEEYLSFTEGLGRIGTAQFCLGAGYSYNWVPFHHGPIQPRTGYGLRNLTLNLTLAPMISFYNHLMTDSYSGGEISNRTRIDGRPGFSLAARGGLAFYWNRYSLCAEVEYNRFGFSGLKSTRFSGDGLVRLDTDSFADFDDLTATLQFNLKF